MALAGAGALALERGDLDRAKQACEEGLEVLAREASEAKLILLSCLGFVALEREEHDQAKQLFEENLVLSREIEDIWWLASSLSNLALVTHSEGDYERATELYEQIHGSVRRAGRQAQSRFLPEQSGKVWVFQGRSRAGCTAHRRGRLWQGRPARSFTLGHPPPETEGKGTRLHQTANPRDKADQGRRVADTV